MLNIKQGLLTAGLATCFAAVSVFSPLIANADTQNTAATRLAGVDRYETAAKIADEGWKTTSTYAVLTAGEDEHLVDALAAAPLAKAKNAPVLLTETNQLNTYTEAELKRLGVKTVYLATGEASFDPAVLSKLNGLNLTVVKLGGTDRFATALNIANQLGTPKQIVITTAWQNADALSIASIAAAKGMPILLTDVNQIPQDVASYIEANKANITSTYVLGGTGVVSDGVLKMLPNATRIGGLDRYDTNLKILTTFASDFQNTKTYIANGEDAHLVDALAGASLAAQTFSPVILVKESELGVSAKDLAALKLSSNLVALGGNAAVSGGVLDQLIAELPPAPVAVVGGGGAGPGPGPGAGGSNPSWLSGDTYNGPVSVTSDGTYGPTSASSGLFTVNGDMTLGGGSNTGLTLQDVKVTGTLTLNPGVSGTVSLNNVTAGNVVVRSGASSSIHLIGVTINGVLTINTGTQASPVRIVAEGTTLINNTNLDSGAILEATTSAALGFGQINVESTAATATNKTIQFAGTINSPVTVAQGANGLTLQVASGAALKQLTLQAPVFVQADSNGTITTVEVSKVVKVTFAGQGNISSVKVTSEAAGAEIAVDPTSGVTLASLNLQANITLSGNTSAVTSIVPTNSSIGVKDATGVPIGISQFNSDQEANLADYYLLLSTLSGLDFNSSDIIPVPSKETSGSAITWTTEEPNVISFTTDSSTMGAIHINRSHTNQVVSITATVTKGSIVRYIDIITTIKPPVIQPSVITMLSPNRFSEGYSSPMGLNVTGNQTSFTSGTTQLTIYDSTNQVIPVGTLTVKSTTSAGITLPTGLGVGTYIVQLTTSSEVVKSQFTIEPYIKISPNNISEGYQNIVLKATGRDTHFVDGTTSVTIYDSNKNRVALGSSIIVTDTTTAAITLSNGLPLGQYTVEIKTGSELAHAWLSVNPMIVLEPNNLAEGYTTSTAINVTGFDTHFDGTTQLTIFDSNNNDVTGASMVKVTNSTSAAISLVALPNGSYTVKLATELGTVSEERSYAHLQIGPNIYVSPNNISEGYHDAILRVIASNTHFDSTTSITIYDSKNNQVALGSTITVTDTTTATINLSNGLPIGRYTVEVKTGSELLDTSLSVNPSIVLDPNNLATGGTTSTAINVTGIDTHFNGTTQLTIFDSNHNDVTGASTVKVSNSTSAVINLNVALPNGSYTVKLATEPGTVSEERSYANLQIGPYIKAFPNSLDVGYQNGLLNVVGTNTHFTSTTSVTIYDSNNVPIALGYSITITDTTTAAINLSNGLPVGQYTVEVKTGSELLDTSLSVNPSIVLDPNNLAEGYSTSTAITVTGIGTHFNGTTQLTIFDSNNNNVTGAATVVVTNSTSAVINLNVALPVGGYWVKLTTGLGTVTEEKSYSYLNVGPNINLSPNTLDEGYQNTVLNVNGINTHFDSTTSVTIYDSNNTPVAIGSSIAVADATNASISLSNGLPVGQYKVEIKTGTELVDASLWINTKIVLNTNNLVVGYTTPTVISVTGFNTHFDTTTQLKIYNFNDVTGSSTVNETDSTSAAIYLNTALPVGDYTVELSTGTEHAYSYLMVNPSLGLAPATLPNGTVGVTYWANIATGGIGPYTNSVSGSTISLADLGLFLDPYGDLVGLPTTPGAFQFIVTETDSSNVTTSAAFSLTITQPASYQSGASATPSMPSIMSGSALNLDIVNAQGTDGNPLIGTHNVVVNANSADGQVYNGSVNFNNGAATIMIPGGMLNTTGPGIVLDVSLDGIAIATPTAITIADYAGGASVTSNVFPNTLEEGYQNTVLNVIGINTHFDSTTSVTIYDSNNTPVAIGSSIAVADATNASISLSNGLPVGQYKIEIKTGTELVDASLWINTKIVLNANNLVVGYTTPTVISVTGFNTHFATTTTQLTIFDSNYNDVTGSSTVNVTDSTSAAIYLNTALPVGDYTVELSTGTEHAYSYLMVNPSLGLAPATLPSGTVGVTYWANIATGGIGPYTNSVSGSTISLADLGLFLDPYGDLVGLPTTPGAFQFIVTETDSSNVTTSAAFSLTITQPASYQSGASATPSMPSIMSGSALNLDIVNAQGTDGNPLIGTHNVVVNANSADGQVYNGSVYFNNGAATIMIPGGMLNTTGSGIVLDVSLDGIAIATPTAITIADYAGGASVTSSAISITTGSALTLNVSKALGTDNQSLMGKHSVGVSSSADGIVFSDLINFNNGAATIDIPAGMLNTTGSGITLNLSIDQVANTTSTAIDVIEKP